MRESGGGGGGGALFQFGPYGLAYMLLNREVGLVYLPTI